MASRCLLAPLESATVMDLAAYKNCMEQMPYGKKLPNALYVLCGDEARWPEPLAALVARLRLHCGLGEEFNIVKFRTDELRISFLSYPKFFEEAHPSLEKSVAIDLVTGKTRETGYSGNLNPPILHRKETFIPLEHPKYAEFASLTRAEEEAGLYQETATIGFKLNWENLLKSKGVSIQGHRLVGGNYEVAEEIDRRSCIDRHKTALTRYELSKPIKGLLEYGLLTSTMTLFDYGCGQGADIRGLTGLGFSCDGWDPVYRPDVPKQTADIVNLGYVLNVIEHPAERVETLVDAFRYAKRILVVSALINETVEANRATQFADGFLTRRNTFQKFFEQHELQQFIEDALETTAVPVSLGIFYVFRDPSDQQDFLSARSRRTIDWTQLARRLGLGEPPKGRWDILYEQNQELLDAFGELALRLGRFPEPNEFQRLPEIEDKLGSGKRALRAFVLGGRSAALDWREVSVRFGIGQPPKRRAEILYEAHRELLDEFWDLLLRLGRLPAPEEFARYSELCAAIGSAKRALRLFMHRGGGELLQKSADSRRNDLLVYLALANLRKRVPFGHLSSGLRLDVRSFFGNYTRALEKGLELLYAAGDSGEIELACEELREGWQDEQALYVHRSLLERLPPILRAFVGCATTLFGDVTQADVVKLHKSSGKVTFLAYDDFENKPFPELQTRIKVNLRTRWVQVYDHSAERQLLCFKERYVASDHPRRNEMTAFSSKLQRLGLAVNASQPFFRHQLDILLQQHGLNENLNRRRKI